MNRICRLTVALVALLTSGVRAQGQDAIRNPAAVHPARTRLAVATFTVFLIDSQYGSAVSEMISSDLTRLKDVELVEREKLDKVLSEHVLGQSGVILPEQAAETGKMVGAERMLIGSVGKLGMMLVLNARIVDVKTGNVTGAWSATGTQEADLVRMVNEIVLKMNGSQSDSSQTEGAQPSGPSFARQSIVTNGALTGTWASEWYDSKGKHAGSIYIRQSGDDITGWTVEDIGPAKIKAKLTGPTMEGRYTADYGSGEFEFTVSQDGQRLIGTYGTSLGEHGTWNVWRRDQPVAAPVTGTRVLADWSGDIWTYPGTVEKADGPRVVVKFDDDGTTEALIPERVFAFDIRAGDDIYVAQSDRAKYTYATVVETPAKGESKINVEYRDGSRRLEPLSRIRVLRVRSSGY